MVVVALGEMQKKHSQPKDFGRLRLNTILIERSSVTVRVHVDLIPPKCFYFLL